MKKFFCPYCQYPVFLDMDKIEEPLVTIICETCEDYFVADDETGEDSSYEEMLEYEEAIGDYRKHAH